MTVQENDIWVVSLPASFNNASVFPQLTGNGIKKASTHGLFCVCLWVSPYSFLGKIWKSGFLRLHRITGPSHVKGFMPKVELVTRTYALLFSGLALYQTGSHMYNDFISFSPEQHPATTFTHM